jgi:epsilon-lactone hydrolase
MASEAYEKIIAGLWALPRVPGRPVEQQRADSEAMADQFPPPAGTVVSAPEGAPVPSLWVRGPDVAADAAIVWLHGGGYTLGSPRGYRRFAGDLSRVAGVSVLLPDYRLAPEHPHPAAVEDGVATYRWLLDQGFAPGRLALGGDSAGGGLTMATLVALRDAGMPVPAAAVVLSPWVDLSLSSETWTTRADVDPLVGRHNAPEMAAAYLNGQDPTTPLASPIHADLKRLPPLLILVGDREVLLDDARALDRRAIEGGVDVVLQEHPEVHHVWPVFAPETDEGKAAITIMATYCADQISGRFSSR